MNYINQSLISFSTTQYYSSLDAQLLSLWQSYRTIPEWAFVHLLVTTYILGVIANTVLLIYFYDSAKYRVPVFTVFTSLAVCDWVTCFTGALVHIAFIPENIFQRGGMVVSKINAHLLTTSYHSSLCHLTFLAGLRYFQLCHPLLAQANVTFSIVVKCCVSMWLLCALIAISYGIYYTVHNISYNNTTIGIYYFSGNYHLKETIKSVFCQAVPLIVISSLHLLKVYKVSKSPKFTQQERRTGSFRTVTIIIALFVLSIIPSMLHNFYHTVLGYPNLPLHTVLFFYSVYSTYLNSMLNPFVYILSSREIRKNIMQTFCVCCMQT